MGLLRYGNTFKNKEVIAAMYMQLYGVKFSVSPVTPTGSPGS